MQALLLLHGKHELTALHALYTRRTGDDSIPQEYY